MTTGPDGQHMTVEQRLADIRARYGPDDPGHPRPRPVGPLLTGAVARVTRKLADCTPRAGSPADLRGSGSWLAAT